MDFSGAQTLMGTFKTFAMYAGAVICLGGLIFAGIRMMSGRFHFNAPDWYSRDLSIDRFYPLLWGKAVTGATMEGWEYWEHPGALGEPEEATVLSSEEWHPVPVSEDQAVLLALIGNDGIAKKDLVAAMMEASELPEDATLDLVRDLNEKRLVAWDDQTLVFLTRRCTTAFTPKDGLVAHDMEDARFVEWMMRDERWRKPPMR